MPASRSSGRPRPFSVGHLGQLGFADFLQRDAVLAGFLFDQLAADFDGALALVDLQPVLDLLAGAPRLDEAQPVAAGMMSGLGEDFDDVAGVELVIQRHDAAVDLRAHAGVAHLRVNGVGEVHRRRLAGKNHDRPLGEKV